MNDMKIRRFMSKVRKGTSNPMFLMSASLPHDEQRDIFDVLAANNPVCSSDQNDSLEVVNETRH